jgi:hypothetical protein
MPFPIECYINRLQQMLSRNGYSLIWYDKMETREGRVYHQSEFTIPQLPGHIYPGLTWTTSKRQAREDAATRWYPIFRQDLPIP